ncbi:hypothetical protein U1Q18_052377 [Sarracenia purpurea var. burkii]
MGCADSELNGLNGLGWVEKELKWAECDIGLGKFKVGKDVGGNWRQWGWERRWRQLAVLLNMQRGLCGSAQVRDSEQAAASRCGKRRRWHALTATASRRWR